MVATMLHGCVTLVRRPRYPGWFSKDVEGEGDAKSSLARIHAPKLNRRGVRAIHDRVCRLFHRPGRMQDVTCLTISSHSTNPPLPSPLLSSLRILADSSSRLLATGLPSYAALRPAPICANLPLRPLSLSLSVVFWFLFATGSSPSPLFRDNSSKRNVRIRGILREDAFSRGFRDVYGLESCWKCAVFGWLKVGWKMLVRASITKSYILLFIPWLLNIFRNIMKCKSR